jgi:hypothetical protein
VFLGVGYVVMLHDSRLQLELSASSNRFDRLSFWALTFFALLPLAMTMALLWKTKQVILDSVFGTRH